ncbi:MAG: hypothetical protein M3Y07_02135 [Acidobacteriota bacterium]|nr:hypothetical protein [Acidobacteriota bacterium]
MTLTAMSKKLPLCFGTLALAMASAASSYNLTLYQPTTVEGKMLKEGECKLELKENTAIIRQGKTSVEANVKPETVDKKFATTSVKYVVEGGKNNIQEIRLGGTKTKLVFEPGRTAKGGA